MSKDRAGGLASERGQSLIELALALPFLVLIFLGVADLGRVFYYTSAITNAAREGASYAAHTAATNESVARRVCTETGFLECTAGVTSPPYGVPPRLQVKWCDHPTPCPRPVALGERVEVSYDFDLISGYLVNAAFGSSRLRLQAASEFPTVR